jgi:lysophospholipase L1-like esterase
MVQKYVILSLVYIFIFTNNAMSQKNKSYSMLNLGDSYTIGEAVMDTDRFPMQAVAMLKKKGINFHTPNIIAKTGWTTDELNAAIQDEKLTKKFDFVTLLIGVNNQYRQRDLDNYKTEFTDLLKQAIAFADGKRERVIVLSIPDWGVTPFVSQDAKKRSGEQIGEEIKQFNEASKEICAAISIKYIDIFPHSQTAKEDLSLITKDGLHPSELMYKHWAMLVARYIEEILK